MLYEQNFQDGQYIGDGRVLAAEFVNAGKRHRAVWFESADGTGHGLLLAGRSAACARHSCARRSTSRASARTSIRGVCIRSADASGRTRVSTTRRRPARRSRQRATGEVEFAGRKGGYGNCRDPESWQRHHDAVRPHVALRDSAPQRWQRVSQGEVIGYVGTHRRGDRAAPALRVPRATACTRIRRTVTMPRTELPTQYLAEFRAAGRRRCWRSSTRRAARATSGLRREHPLSGRA